MQPEQPTKGASVPEMPRRRSLLSYVAERPDNVVFYSRVGDVGVYWPRRRDLARARLSRHLDEHGCGVGDTTSPDYIGGFLNCPEAAELWHDQHPADQVALG